MDKLKFNYNDNYLNRFTELIDIKNNFIFDKVNNICTTLTVCINDKSINYAYIYSNIDKNIINHNLIIFGPNIISGLSEYRTNVIHYSQLSNFKKYSKLINLVKKEIKAKLLIKVYNSDNNIQKIIYNNIINDHLHINIFIITWIFELYEFRVDVNLYLNKLLYDDNLLKILKKKQKELKIQEFINEFKSYKNFKIGGKMSPISIEDISNYKNISYKEWGELYINIITNNLIFKNICNHFSIFVDWIFIKDIDKDIYTNINVYNKLQDSEIISTLSNNINNTILDTNIDLIKNNYYRNTIQNTLSNLLKINIFVDKLHEYKSNLSILYLNKLAGQSFYSYYKYMKNPQIINILFDDFELCSKMLFQIIYTLYSLNLNGIIHNDLHLANILIEHLDHQSGNMIYDLNSIINKNITLFINDKELPDKINSSNKLIFILPSSSYKINIIDFNSALILSKLVKNNYRNYFDKNEYDHTLMINIKNKMHELFPKMMSNKELVGKIFKPENFDVIFIYFSAFDIFEFTTLLLTMYNDIQYICNNRILKLLTDISTYSYNCLKKILDLRTYRNNPIFPNYNILTTYFNHFEYKDKSIEIKDIFVINNIRYSETLSNVEQIQNGNQKRIEINKNVELFIDKYIKDNKTNIITNLNIHQID